MEKLVGESIINVNHSDEVTASLKSEIKKLRDMNSTISEEITDFETELTKNKRRDNIISQYEFLTHMKLNQWANQSHIRLEAFNESSQKWYQIVQCPSGINGPLAWKEYDCKIKIPHNITKTSNVKCWLVFSTR